MPSPIAFDVPTMSLIQDIVSRYPEGRKKSALLPILHLAQSEFGGWLSTQTMDYVASLLDIQSIEVYEVATFYSMFRLSKGGTYVLEVCRTGPCALVGAEEIQAYLEKKLGIKEGETTSDGLFSIKGVECLASCGTGPVIQVGEKYWESLDQSKVDEMIDRLRNDADQAGKKDLS